jgi:hypothetical protein
MQKIMSLVRSLAGLHVTTHGRYTWQAQTYPRDVDVEGDGVPPVARPLSVIDAGHVHRLWGHIAVLRTEH